MSNRETLDYDPVDALIEQGRRELADGKIDKARWCFEEVLRRRPDEPRALLGLSYAARKSESPNPDAKSTAERKDQLEEAASVLSVDVEVVVLVREKRYEEALLKLRSELSKRPEDRTLLRSIAHLEKHIAHASARPGGAESKLETPAAEVPPKITQLRVPNIEGMAGLQETQDFMAPKRTENADEVKPIEPPDASAAFAREAGVRSLVERSSFEEAETPEETDATQPFELMAVASTNRVDAVRINEFANEPVLHEDRESLVDSGEDRVDHLTSSGGFIVADDEPSLPALGSLPAAPSAPPTKRNRGMTWWIFALVTVLALILVFVLR